MSITLARTLRTDRPHRVRRVLVGVVSTAVATAGLAVAGTPAQAAPTGTVTAGTATWGLSTYLNSATGGRPNPLATAYTAPSTFDDTLKLSTWGTPTGTVAANGSATLEFTGTTVNFAKTSGAWLKLKDLRTTLDASGNGSVTAEVSYGQSTTGVPGNLTFDPTQAAQRGPVRVVVASLVGNTASDVSVTRGATTYTGLDAAWNDEFLTFLAGDVSATPSVPPFIYVGQVNNTATDRPPLPISFSVTTEQSKITSAVATSTTDAVSVAVAGTGYNPNSPGVYVAVLTSGRTNEQLSDASEYLGVIWSGNPGNLASAVQPDGSFNTTLTIPAGAIAGIDKNRSYSVYTVKAHGQNAADASQTVEKPITIDFSGFPKKSATPAVSAAASTYGTSSVVSVSVPTVGAFAPTGTVTLNGVGTQALKDGKATFALPAVLAVGTTTLTITYSGDANYAASTASATKTVTAAKVSIKRGSTKKPTTKKTGKSTLTLKSVTGAPVDGKVKVSFTKKGQSTKVKTVTIKAGKGNITIPKLAKGTWTVSVTYAGTANFLKTATLKRGAFTVTK